MSEESGKKDEITMSEKEAFVDWGIENGFSEERAARFKKAMEMHRLAQMFDPEHHHLVERERGRSYYVCSCPCGFSYSYDCSD